MVRSWIKGLKNVLSNSGNDFSLFIVEIRDFIGSDYVIIYETNNEENFFKVQGELIIGLQELLELLKREVSYCNKELLKYFSSDIDLPEVISEIDNKVFGYATEEYFIWQCCKQRIVKTVILLHQEKKIEYKYNDCKLADIIRAKFHLHSVFYQLLFIMRSFIIFSIFSSKINILFASAVLIFSISKLISTGFSIKSKAPSFMAFMPLSTVA